MADIVLVHGIAQEQRSAASLEASWLPVLAGGLENAEHRAIADRLHRQAGAPAGAITVRMAFYGNLYLKPDHQGVGTRELTAAQDLIAEELATELLLAAAESPQPKDAGEAQRVLASLRTGSTRSQGKGAFARSAVAALDRIPWFSRGGVAVLGLAHTTVAQVTQYLGNSGIRAAAINKVAALITQETRAVIGHSLGSVVAYEAIRRLPSGQRLPLLLTIGSPLGLGAVHTRLEAPASFPIAVERWVNLAAPDDIVAAQRDLRGRYGLGRPVGSVLEPTWLVDNGSSPHLAGHYLTKPACGRNIARAVNGPVEMH